jgi:hypothetical protein
MEPERKRYYVSIHSGETMGEILQEPTASPYEFVIDATDEEVQKLNNLMGNNAVEDMETFWDSHIPYLAPDENRENQGYDRTLQQLYNALYRLGTPSTRQQLKTLGLVQPDT